MAKETSAHKKIAIIGAGHIGSALAKGLLISGMQASDIIISTHTVAKAGGFAEKGVSVIADNVEAVKDADIVFIAVKPLSLKEVADEIASHIKGKTVVSLAAIVSLAALEEWFKDSGAEVARAMPNMPIAIGEGVVGLYTKTRSAEKKLALEHLLKNVGMVVSVSSDKEIDMITLVSGCGPGIVSFLVDSVAKAAEGLGMERKMAENIVMQTFSGTLAYLHQTGKTPSELAAEVATKGGVTETILGALERAEKRERRGTEPASERAEKRERGTDLAGERTESDMAQAFTKGQSRITELKKNYEQERIQKNRH